MKIGYFGNFPYITKRGSAIGSAGGVGYVSYNLALEMAKRGHEIYVFTPTIDQKNYVETHKKIKIYRYKKSITIGNTPISFGGLYKPLKEEIDLDIVHAHLGNLPTPLTAYWYAKKLKIPFVITHHGDYVGGFGDPIRRTGVFLYNLYFADKLLSSADIIIALSAYLVNKSKFLGKYPEKIKVIPNGVNLEEFRIHLSREECKSRLKLPSHRKIILFIGSLTPIKAPHILLTAMKRVIKEMPDSCLIFVGDGIMKQELKELSKTLGINDKIIFTGFVGNIFKKSMYYKVADILVLPSVSEGFPIVLLEASTCGLPLIVSNLEYFKAIVREGYNGLFTRTLDEKDLADKIIYLLQNSDIRKKLGKNSKKNIKNFTWKRVGNMTEKIYFDLVR